MRRAALLCALVLALPAAAHAGTITYSSTNVLSFTAAAGEVNRLSVSISGDRVVYHEDVLNITEAEADCDGNGTPTVSCKIDHVPASPVFSAGADVGDMDDRVTASFPADSTMAASFIGDGGADELDGSGSANVFLDGGEGADKLTAGRGRSFLTGGNGADMEFGGPALTITEFDMGSGPDGADELNGGAGLDTVSYEGRAAAITATADDVADDGEAMEGDKISQAVEVIQGGNGNDNITASQSVDAALSGYGGNDRLVGGPGDDTLFGGDGDDAAVGNGGDDLVPSSDLGRPQIGGGPIADVGADSFDGGDGFDTLDYSTRVAAVSVTPNGQPDDGEAGEGDNTGADVERIIGGRGGDSLMGDASDQEFVGGSGNDTINPGEGEDRVLAGEGDDTVGVQDGVADRVACGVGADTAQADAADTLTSCENATVAPALPGEDHTAPHITIRNLRAKLTFKQLARGVRFRVSGDEPASFVAELFGTAKRATLARAYNLSLARRKLPLGSGLRLVRLKPARSLLGKRHRMKVRLRITATDASGNSRSRNRVIMVRR